MPQSQRLRHDGMELLFMHVAGSFEAVVSRMTTLQDIPRRDSTCGFVIAIEVSRYTLITITFSSIAPA